MGGLDEHRHTAPGASLLPHQTGYDTPEFLSPFFLNNSALQIFVGQATSSACQIDGDCSGLPLTAQILSGTQSFGSGVAVGLLGPVLSPVAALINSVTAIVDYLSAGDFIGAINEVVNIPANLVNGFLNGAHLDLTPIVNLVTPGIAESVGLNLGGLISPPVPLNGSFTDPADPPTEFSGGTLLDATTVTLASPAVEAPGVPGGVGPIGSLIEMGQYLSKELLVTPPDAPAAEAAAAVEPAPVEETPTVENADSGDAVAEAAASRTGVAETAAPGSAATTRAARGSAAAAAADARSGDNDRATHRGQRGAR